MFSCACAPTRLRQRSKSKNNNNKKEKEKKPFHINTDSKLQQLELAAHKYKTWKGILDPHLVVKETEFTGRKRDVCESARQVEALQLPAFKHPQVISLTSTVNQLKTDADSGPNIHWSLLPSGLVVRQRPLLAGRGSDTRRKGIKPNLSRQNMISVQRHLGIKSEIQDYIGWGGSKKMRT